MYCTWGWCIRSQDLRSLSRQKRAGFDCGPDLCVGCLGWIGCAFEQILQGEIQRLRQRIPSKPAYLCLFFGSIELWLTRDVFGFHPDGDVVPFVSFKNIVG